MATIADLIKRRDELKAALAAVRGEIASRAGEVDSPKPAKAPAKVTPKKTL